MKIEMVKVVSLTPMGDFTMFVRFSNGLAGTAGFSHFVGARGSASEPLFEEAFFNRVTVIDGIPTWPNGYDIDAIALHMRMKAAGLLHSATQAAE